MKQDEVAKAITDTLISPNESDRNFEAANVVDALFEVGRAIRSFSANLGRGEQDSPGAVELLAMKVEGAGSDIASAIRELAEAVRGHGFEKGAERSAGGSPEGRQGFPEF